MIKLTFCSFVAFFLLDHHSSANICCTPDQWEAFLFLDYGNVFIDSEASIPNTAYSLINGTVKLSYDYTNQRIYMFVNGTVYSPLIPKPGPYATLFLYDFKQGIEYQVLRGECEKSKLDTNMTRLCVPDGAERIKGTVGIGGVKAVDYSFAQKESSNLNVFASVTADSCIPLHVVYHSAVGSSDSGGILSNLEALDIVPGIKDPSVFDVPEACKNIGPEINKMQIKSEIGRFVRSIWF